MKGDIAQLVERCVRNAEVRGSSPLISTTASEQGSLCSDVFLLLAAASAAKSRRCIAPLPLPFCAKGSVCCGLFMMKPARVHAAASPFPRRKARRARRARGGGGWRGGTDGAPSGLAGVTHPAHALRWRGGNKGDASSGLFIKSFLVHAAALR